MLHLYVTDRVSRAIGALDVLLLTLSILVAARYPYWVAESIPMVFVPALTISVWWMAERGQRCLRVVCGRDACRPKWVRCCPKSRARRYSFRSALPASPRMPEAFLSARLAALGVAVVFGIYSTAMLIHFVPLFTAIVDIGPESYRIPRWYFVCRDAGALLMVGLKTGWSRRSRLRCPYPSDWRPSSPSHGYFRLTFVCVCLVLGLKSCFPAAHSQFLRG